MWSDVRPRRWLKPLTGLMIAATWVSTPVHASASSTAHDVAAPAGVNEVTISWSATSADVDDDGDMDVLLGRHQEAPRLYFADGSTFTELAPGSFPARDRHDCDAADVDQDGRIDLYCTIGAAGGRIEKHNELWMQQPDGTYVDRARAFGVEDPFGRGRRVTFLDLDQDAYPDLFVGNTYPRKDDNRSPNRLFVDMSGAGFSEVRRSGVTHELGARCVQAVDVDADGWDDLLVCGKEKPLHLYRNDHHNGFDDVTAEYGIRGEAWSAEIGDIDGNGSLDLVQLDADVLRVQLGAIQGFRQPAYVQRLRRGAWVAEGDVDRDGLTDLYVVQGCDEGRNLIDYLLAGHGHARFSSVPIPQTHDGCGGYALPMDYDDDGRTDFLVLNGQGHMHDVRMTGPVQLISFGG
jgi:hypothetical protein